MVGWSPWVDCGLTDEQVSALMGDANYTGSATALTESKPATVQAATPLGEPVDVTGYYTVKRGCKGGAVEAVQSWLVDLGLRSRFDHRFWPRDRTTAPVPVFPKQTNGPLEATGCWPENVGGAGGGSAGSDGARLMSDVVIVGVAVPGWDALRYIRRHFGCQQVVELSAATVGKEGRQT